VKREGGVGEGASGKRCWTKGAKRSERGGGAVVALSRSGVAPSIVVSKMGAGVFRPFPSKFNSHKEGRVLRMTCSHQRKPFRRGHYERQSG